MFPPPEAYAFSGGMFMKKRLKTYLFWILLSEAVGILAAIQTQEGMIRFRETAVQPPFSPSPILFTFVWPLLYALMGFGAARVWLAAPRCERQTGINLFFAQLIFQFFWSLLFFNAGAYGLSFYWLAVLWVLILLMILAFGRADRAASLLQIPYLLWVTFAGVLNFAVLRLNR